MMEPIIQLWIISVAALFTATNADDMPPVTKTFGIFHNLHGGVQYDSNWGTGFCDEECKCGVPNNQEAVRIVGGKPTAVNEYPWMAALILGNNHIRCGGTLISNLHVLTAAHCVYRNFLISRAKILLGEHDLNNSTESPTQIRGIASVVRHRRFRPSFGMDNDIAIIRMSAPVEFNTGVSPACLPSPGVDFGGAKGIIAGWGVTTEGGRPSSKLRAAVVPILNQNVCGSQSKWYYRFLLSDNMMCAGYIEGGTDSCQGDSGGGLLALDSHQRMVVAGIVSWGGGCARPLRPGVYTRVTNYMSWIQYNTREGCFCA